VKEIRMHTIRVYHQKGGLITSFTDSIYGSAEEQLSTFLNGRPETLFKILR
jgi:hypothetical protein